MAERATPPDDLWDSVALPDRDEPEPDDEQQDGVSGGRGGPVPSADPLAEAGEADRAEQLLEVPDDEDDRAGEHQGF